MDDQHPFSPTPEVPDPPVHPVCSRCGASAPAGPPPLTWVLMVEDGRTQLVCDRCVRDNLRAIEAKLDSAWW